MTNKPSRWHYLLPIFFGLLGGVAGYLLVQDRDKELARNLIVAGIVMQLVIPMVTVLLAGMMYGWTSTIMQAKVGALTAVGA